MPYKVTRLKGLSKVRGYGILRNSVLKHALISEN